MSDPNIESAGLFDRCTGDESLRRWLKLHLSLDLPREPVCPGHCSPFEYVRQAYFHEVDLVVWAPRGGGKTRLAAALTFAELLHKPGISIRILGGSMAQSLRMWEHLCADAERLLQKDAFAGRPRATSFRLLGGSSAGVLAQSQRSIRGVRVQKLRCDEVDNFAPEVWEAAQLVTRSTRDARGLPIAAAVEAISTMHERAGLMHSIVQRAQDNAQPVLRWCLMEVLERCPPQRDCATCPLHEDCQGRAKTLCDGFFSIDDAIRIKRRVSRDTWLTEMMCSQPPARGAVFRHFDPRRHIVQELPPPAAAEPRQPQRAGLFLGIDFGYANPFVCLWIRRDLWGRTFVIDEYVRHERTMDEHIAEIRSRPHGEIHRVYCDPAGNGPNDQTGRSNVERLKERWIVRSCASRIQDGLELIRAALCTGAGSASLLIHPRCIRLIEAMKNYHYRQGAGENPEKDGNDHPVDALRYYFINSRSANMVGAWY